MARFKCLWWIYDLEAADRSTIQIGITEGKAIYKSSTDLLDISLTYNLSMLLCNSVHTNALSLSQ